MGLFKMPSLGADMEAGKLTEWMVKPGDTVKRGDIVAVVETQKGAIEIEIFQDGTVQSLLIEPGTTVPVGTAMADISGVDEAAAPAPPSPTPAPEETPAPSPAPPAPAAPATAIPAAGERRISPAARALAAEKGVDLAGIAGTGPAGAVVYADVEAAPGGAAPAKPKQAAPKQAAPGEKTVGGFDFGAMRTAIAAAMARAKREIPHYYLEQSIDMTAALAWLARTNEGRPPAERLLAGALLVKAVAAALKRFPEFNGFYEDGAFRHGEAIHVGVAIAIRGGGLVAPAIHDTDTLPLDDVMAALRDLTARVRAGRFRGSELSDPTITVSSLGERGVDALYAVIYPPQVAIIGMGSIVERPRVVDGKVVPRSVVTATLSADHRVSDGHRGALLLRKIEELLQKPEAL